MVGGALRNLGAGMTLMMTVPIVGFFKASVDAAIKQENAMAELNAVLASTGGVAGVTADELTKMAAELQKVTKFGDETIISGQSMLLTFTKIGKDVFPEATEAMLNLAEKFGSMDQAAVMLGKALNDPIQGISALRRVGIQLSAQQEEQIRNFMAVGDIASAQKVILAELEVQFGGLARAAGDTTAGKFAQLKNAFGDLQEVAGEALIPHLLKLTEFLTILVDKFMALPPGAQDAIFAFMLFLAVLGPIIGGIGQLILTIQGIITLAPAVSSVFAALSAGIPALGGLSAAAATAGTAIAGVAASIGAVLLPILLIVGAVALLYWAFKTNFMGITTTVEQLWFIIKHYFNEGWQWLLEASNDGLVSLGEALVTGFQSMQDRFRQFIDWVQQTWARLRDFLM
jgi:hypothetical protein